MPIHSRKRCHQLLGFGGAGGAAGGGEFVADGVAFVIDDAALVSDDPALVGDIVAFVGDAVDVSAPASSEVSVPERPGEEPPVGFREPAEPRGLLAGTASSSIGGGAVKWISLSSSKASKPTSKPAVRATCTRSLNMPIPEGRMRKTK